jgi:aldose 1-epimerase
LTAAGAPPPSGRQHVIRHGDQRAVVVQVGGGLREYEVGGFAVLDGYAEDRMANVGRGQVLAPWPNRLADGRYELDGRTHQLALSDPVQRTAIHGLVRWSGWDTLEAAGSRVRLGHVLWPQPGYPYTLRLEIEYELSDAGLRVVMGAENAGRQPAPYGMGMHPYVRAEAGLIDGSVLRLPADSFLEADERRIPTGRRLDVAGTPYDFREPRPIGETAMDVGFTGLARDAGGLAWTELRSEARGRRVAVWVDAGFEYLMVFTGNPLGAGERRRSLAVEPMTCAPDAFRNRLGLVVLEPGQRLSASWGISVSRFRRAGGR